MRVAVATLILCFQPIEHKKAALEGAALSFRM